MRKPKIDAAVMALLLPAEPDGIDDAYLESLVDEFERRRAAYARDVAGHMHGDFGPLSPPQVARFRAKYLDMLLAFRPNDMKAVLLGMMEDDEDFGRSAVLFLYGHEHQAWDAKEGEIERARELANLPPEEPALDVAKLDAFTGLMQSFFDTERERRASVSAEDIVARVKRVSPATAAARKMHTACADPKASPEHKLDAIRHWLDALEEAGERAVVLEFCVMGRLALMKAEAKRKAH
jgi:hypothetical protein